MEAQDKYAKAKWAEILGVSTSGYYTWRHEREVANNRALSGTFQRPFPVKMVLPLA